MVFMSALLANGEKSERNKRAKKYFGKQKHNFEMLVTTLEKYKNKCHVSISNLIITFTGSNSQVKAD